MEICGTLNIASGKRLLMTCSKRTAGLRRRCHMATGTISHRIRIDTIQGTAFSESMA